jgi:hypothetical protein
MLKPIVMIPMVLSPYVRRQSDINGSSVCYVLPTYEICISLAHNDTSERGELAALVSFSMNVS